MQPPREAETSPLHRDAEAVLRAKYLDYCSAQVAEVLLRLSPDEIFVLAQEAAKARGEEAAPSYDSMVEMATVRIYRQLELPPFEEWVVQYREDPARFESEILGLWESDRRLTPKDS